MSRDKLKKRLYWLVDRLSTLFIVGFVLVAVWIIIQFTSIASFKIPSDSMEPALLAGDNIIVNKWVMGARVFNIFDAVEQKEVNISRLPGLGKIARNDILVFNFPYPAAWDSIGLNVMNYYVKRCVALPGDTFEIRNAHYQVRGYGQPLGDTEAQDDLQDLLDEGRADGVVLNGYPYHEQVSWNIREFGPLYVPAKGSTVELTPFSLALYKNVIEWEQKKKLALRDSVIQLGNEPIDRYCFLHNYYFMAGDKVRNSQDSRYWGLLPEEYIVGKASFIWKSKNSSTGKIRWERIFKRIE